LSNYTAASVLALVADINAANKAGGTNTITLAANTTFDLAAVNNTTNGANGLPVISGKKGADNLTIIGNGATIERSTASGTLDFRLFDVASGNSLTLQNVALQNGRVGPGFKIPAEGGAIFNQGTLVLSGVMIQNNAAVGSGGDAAGGGVWSNGSLTLENSSAVQGNSATGGLLRNAFGGGIYVAGGTANITGTTFTLNLAQGGDNGGSAYGGAVYVAGGTVTMSADNLGTPYGFSGPSPNIARGNATPGLTPLGNGYGGGLYVAGGSVTLTNDSILNNEAAGWNANTFAFGGGIFIASGATVYVDSFTVANTLWNVNYSYWTNTSYGDDIWGPYILLP
jgi:hypothetical protein